MSGPDRGDQDKSFLARWSQRKQEAKRPDPGQDTPIVDSPGSSPPPATGADAPEGFDLSTLPKLEDLTGTTDITPFLRKGVPRHLRNAALRRSWALDPAIRNYVNPALDYAYDWNTPGGVPGSSEIGAGMDVERMVSQIMGSGEPVAEPSNPAADGGNELASGPSQLPDHPPAQQPEPDLPRQALRLSDEATAQGPSNAEGGCIESGQAEESEARNSVAPQQTVRRHGTAKPIV
jgi:hypothetical protein